MFTLDELENNLEFENNWQNAELDRAIDDLLLFEDEDLEIDSKGISCVTPGNPYILHCFSAHKSELTPLHHEHLDRIAAKIVRSFHQSNPITRVEIIGRAATWREIPKKEYSRRALVRAKNVRAQLRNRLKNAGLGSQITIAVGHRADKKPLVDNKIKSLTPSAQNNRAFNRRVEIFLKRRIEPVIFTPTGTKPKRKRINLIEPTTKRSSVMIDRCAKPYFNCLMPFEKTTIDWESIRQQRINNCPLPAIVAALARLCPKKLKNTIRLKNQPYKSTMKGRPGKGPSIIEVTFIGAKKKVNISPRLHFPRPRDRKNLVVPKPKNLMFAKASDGGWIGYIEKAYVVFRGRNKYENLDYESKDPPSLQQVFLDVIGPFHQIQTDYVEAPRVVDLNIKDSSLYGEPRRFTRDFFKRFLKKAKTTPTIAGTWGDPTSLTHDHTYLILGLRGNSVEVKEFIHGIYSRIPIREFFQEFNIVLQSAKKIC